jgi:hypothetical protein
MKLLLAMGWWSWWPTSAATRQLSVALGNLQVAYTATLSSSHGCRELDPLILYGALLVLLLLLQQLVPHASSLVENSWSSCPEDRQTSWCSLELDKNERTVGSWLQAALQLGWF